MYSTFDTGNYFVIPGIPNESSEWDTLTFLDKKQLQAKMDLVDDDFVIAVVSSQFMYKGLWLDHTLTLQALKPLLIDLSSNNSANSGLNIFVLTGDSTGNYTQRADV